MKTTILEILRCPRTGERLALDRPEYIEGRVSAGWLVSESGAHRYPIHGFIPRFVPESNYADNFGMQWNHFRQTQLDSYSGHPISTNRFWKATGWRPEELAGKWVLDAGCGAGRFAEVALKAGARVLALDYSCAVDACYANLKCHSNLHVVQGDIYALPLAKSSFDYVYSLGVLQHTPNVAKAFEALPPMVSHGGQLCADFYCKRVTAMLHGKYLLRPITRRIKRENLFKLLKKAVPFLLSLSQQFGQVPVAGRLLKRLVPVADYTNVYPLNKAQLREWALLDTFDMLAPEYDHPQTVRTVRRWLETSSLADTDVFLADHLVARGRKAP
jgi:2-polyprenyl-3-methyl-5-hydroxy-6-metoxy-1,4-benzoquinol methylase